MARRKSPPDCVADTRGDTWIGLPQCVKKSFAYRTLSYPARAVLIEIIGKSNGFNNGKIAASQAYLMEELGTTSPRTIVEAISELVEHGLIEVTFDGDWKPRKARTFRLTFINTMRGIARVRATNDYLSFDGPRRREKPRW